MIAALTQLLLFQLIGEVLSRLLALPVPGPVLGMLLLFVALSLRPALADGLRDTAGSLLQHLSLLFVPAGVGVMLHFPRMADEWLPIAVALIVSTVLALAVTALVMRALMRGKSADGNAA